MSKKNLPKIKRLTAFEREVRSLVDFAVISCMAGAPDKIIIINATFYSPEVKAEAIRRIEAGDREIAERSKGGF